MSAASPEISLRPAAREDLAFLFDLREASLGAYVAQVFGPRNADEERARFFERTDLATHRIVTLAGRPVGCLAVRRLPGEVRLDRVFLLPELQNRGIGSRLLEGVLCDAAAAGLPVRLRVLRGNPAQRLYARLGFTVTGSTDTHVLMEHAGAGKRRVAAALAGLGASALAVAAPWLGGRARPGYSHVSQLISELGESGAPGAGWVSTAGFAPIGALVLLFLALAARALPASRWKLPGLVCLGAVGVGYLAAWLAPCDPGCPPSGSLSQAVHNAFGALEYAGAIAGLLFLGASFRGSPRWSALAPACAAAAVLVALGFAVVLLPPLAGIRGLGQRLAEGAIFLWIAAVSAFLLRARGA